jgi:hypothetical protein
MDGDLKIGEMIEARYDRIVLRVRQRQDHLDISVYDARSTQPEIPVWEGESRDLQDAQDAASAAASKYFTQYKLHLIEKGDKATGRVAATGRLPELQPILDWQRRKSD